jgi:hypothetical protein
MSVVHDSFGMPQRGNAAQFSPEDVPIHAIPSVRFDIDVSRLVKSQTAALDVDGFKPTMVEKFLGRFAVFSTPTKE